VEKIPIKRNFVSLRGQHNHIMDTDPSFSSWYRLIGVASLLFLLLPRLSATSVDAQIEAQVDRIIAFAEEEVKERLQLLDQSLLEHRLDATVRKLIATHLRYPAQTSRNLGRAIAYFPIFEAELAAAGMPATLKYLPVIESALLANAISRVGAEGLWQFMPETAPEYGLTIDHYLDERLDTYRATQGAIRYLQSAYEYLGDWSLAIAAYNAGKGSVRRAQRRSGGKNFWAVRRYLPRETRNYVPAFIAAIYLTEFYAAHEITPTFPSLDEQLVERMIIEVPLSFYRIAQVTGLSIELIQNLNPGYKKGYLPAYPGGHNLILPQRVIPAMNTYLEEYGQVEDEPVLPWAPIFKLDDYQPNDQEDYRSFTTLVVSGDSLSSVAGRLSFSSSQLAIWNNISPLDSLVEGQKLRFFRPVRFHNTPSREVMNNKWRAPLLSSDGLASTQFTEMTALPAEVKVKICFQLDRRTKPSEILARFPEVDNERFFQQNDISKDRALRAGSLIYLPSF
jgi:membrane-bound lytic murein transglycosylase D